MEQAHKVGKGKESRNSHSHILGGSKQCSITEIEEKEIQTQVKKYEQLQMLEKDEEGT